MDAEIICQIHFIITLRRTVHPFQGVKRGINRRKFYSDEKAQPLFNADNCTSDFRCSTLKEMTECVQMWVWSYEHGYFVRWTILDGDRPVGTVEMFRRDDGTDGRGSGVLRLDLGHEYERADVLRALLEAVLPDMHALFGCAQILTKAPEGAEERRAALKSVGFQPAPGAVRRADGTAYQDYWSRRA